MKRVITYGTFDTLHFGHIRLLERAKSLGDYLIVGLSTDSFNANKGKKALHSWEERKRNLEAVRYVDLVIPEANWMQKATDIELYHVDIFTIGSDWSGKFDDLSALCKVIYLERTEGISSTQMRSVMSDSGNPSGN